ncbi:MFS transporter [Catenovulum sp. 2E275]|uniref:MFS transporter n=1 Tax=Catenovulum sp. 2E275 TaxID=2980497 RepID=UPI0021D2D656|nr:MFS transporter [Catenovulum sp. 2E275]MCU4675849.1 MFS transporter [Catenovulum sp. 2E275]
MKNSTFSLLKQRTFLPYFCTQALGTMNDNVYKNSLLLIVAFMLPQALPASSDLIINIAAALFILPFFLFSAHAGLLADKFEKSTLIRVVKWCELGIMLVAAWALISQNVIAMLLLLFLMGTQSAYFGPVKYALLPQHLKPEQLLKGNALVEMGTFLAILLGTLLAGVLIGLENGAHYAAWVVVGLACAGLLTAYFIPKANALNSELKLSFNPFSQTGKILKLAKQNRAVFLSILGISWFWFLGATYLTQFPNFAKIYLVAEPEVVSVLLAIFSIGIGLGSLLCSKLSGDQIELGLVPIGSIGLTIFGAHLMFAVPDVSEISSQSFSAFMQNTANWVVMLDLTLIGLFGGLYIVPLYALIQQRTQASKRAQIIAANNVLNAIFMVVSAIFAIVCLSVIGLTIPQLFLVLAVLNALVAVYIYYQVPEFTLRLMIWLLTHCMYRVKASGESFIPKQGAVVLAANHISYVDALIISSVCRRPIRFVMDKSISELPLLKYFFKHAKVIPICPPRQNRETYDQAFMSIKQALESDEVVCIFPEGRLTPNGQLSPFKKGIERILANNPVPVIPVGLTGLWGSFFSHKNGHALTKLPSRFWSKVNVEIEPAIAAPQVTAERLQDKIQQMLDRTK